MPAFPEGFTWGVASAAYQVEGAYNEGGRGLSVWDTASHRPGFVYQGHTGDVACDTYHRYEEDSKLLQELGVHAYRLSVSWPRVLPEGVGKPNEAGLDYYDRLIDSLLAVGVKPWVTLFHWDYPQALFDRGGWFSPDSPKWFADYTALVVDRLSDRVAHWFTQNEPQCYIGLGHVTGNHAPGYKFDRRQAMLAHYHSLLGHGLSVQVIRERTKQPAKVGCAPCGTVYFPLNADRPEDVEAARQLTYDVPAEDGWIWSVAWFCDPIILGKYTELGVERHGKWLPKVSEADLKTMRQPLDFFGFNIYSGLPATTDAAGKPVCAPWPTGYPQTMMGWPVSPEAIRWGIRFLYERYNLPVVITENGLGSMDWVHADGKVHDPGRIDFLTRYLSALRQGITDGVDIRGYFQWSVMDNFEWAEGYAKRFGLIYIDYPTQQRVPKDSYHWYKRIIASNGCELPTQIAPLR